MRPFQGRSVAERYRGPAFLTADRTPCFILVAQRDSVLKHIRDSGPFGLILWRWDISPSMFMSLTLSLRQSNARPHTRWMGPSDNEVIQRIRETGRFLVTVATTDGRHCGWHEAVIHASTSATSMEPDLSAFENLWTFRTSGLPHSSLKVRYTFFDPADYKDDAQIPLWSEPTADFWRTLSSDGPWTEDLSATDRARSAWGFQAWKNRHLAAGAVQLVIERRKRDHEPSPFPADGRFLLEAREREAYNALIDRYPLIGRWVAALAGPDPDAKRAHDCMLEILKNAEALFVFLSQALRLLNDLHVEEFEHACRYSLEAALLDATVTREGSARPWLRNTFKSTLELEALPLDLSLDEEDLKELWLHAAELIDIVDGGLYLTGRDVPAPFDVLCEAFDKVVVEGSVEQVEARVQALLHEAQEARQWSIPWGARVAIEFGPFVALRIFEMSGEFSCHFLDERERYFPVAIGINRGPPRAASPRLLRMRHDDGEPLWNEDAEASIKLIAAAIVRDFLIVEERESLFRSRNYRRRVGARDIRTVIYLPRVRYSAPRLQDQPSEPAPSVRARHGVSHHLRRAKDASAAQRFLAQRYGIELPPGFTFVRAHERGVGASQERIKVYRSRSASRMLFQELDVAPEGSRPAWFDFEKDCARLLRSEGMNVIHRAAHRDGDGGVDLYAVDASEQSWVVQCKCWAAHREVPLAVIRELSGAIALADEGASRPSRGMVITTSRFSSGAKEVADQLGFVLIDGKEFAQRLSRLHVASGFADPS